MIKNCLVLNDKQQCVSALKNEFTTANEVDLGNTDPRTIQNLLEAVEWHKYATFNNGVSKWKYATISGDEDKSDDDSNDDKDKWLNEFLANYELEADYANDKEETAAHRLVGFLNECAEHMNENYPDALNLETLRPLPESGTKYAFPKPAVFSFKQIDPGYLTKTAVVNNLAQLRKNQSIFTLNNLLMNNKTLLMHGGGNEVDFIGNAIEYYDNTFKSLQNGFRSLGKELHNDTSSKVNNILRKIKDENSQLTKSMSLIRDYVAKNKMIKDSFNGTVNDLHMKQYIDSYEKHNQNLSAYESKILKYFSKCQTALVSLMRNKKHSL